jgi:hypothetical protein
MLTACEESLTKLLAKTNQSVSFGDQSFTQVDADKLMRIRNQLRGEVIALENKISGAKRRTIKLHF